MRILYFSRTYTTHDRRFLREIVQAGHKVWYLQLEDDGIRYVADPPPDEVERLCWSTGLSPRPTPEHFLPLLPELDALLRRLRPDLVHAGPVLSCALLCALVGFRPLLTVSWGSDILVESSLNPWNEWAARYVLERSDLFLCDCAPVKERAQTIHPLSNDTVIMFPWGIELARYRQNPEQRVLARSRRGWDDCCVVVSTRSWHVSYGIDVVIEAFAACHKREHRLRLLLLGTGPASPDVFNLIQRHGLAPAVWCPGQVAEHQMVDMLGMADIYLCCTPSDGTSISLLEAMAMGLPVVVTNNVGNQQWVNETNGILVPPGDTAGFAHALEALARDPEKRQRLGQAGRRIVASRADWNRNIALLLEAYERGRSCASSR